MIDKDDWRLRGQEDYLSGKALYFRKWKAPKKEWDHDHCEFCWEKFSDYPDTLHEGYTTEDNYYWICPACYNDFKEMFKWKENDSTGTQREKWGGRNISVVAKTFQTVFVCCRSSEALSKHELHE